MNDSIKLLVDWDEISTSPEGNKTMPSGSAVSISDAMLLTMANKGRIDMGYMKEITGETLEGIVRNLKESIFQNPETWDENPEQGWETTEEYLSGNIYRKLIIANEADRKYGRFDRNVKALSDLLPDFVHPENIYVTIGSPWVPTHVIDDFIKYLFSSLNYNTHTTKPAFRVKHDEYGWEIPFKSRYGYSVLATKTYGTSRLSALQILEMTLNMKAAVVYDEVDSQTTKSGMARILNEEETMMALEKQQLLIQSFKDWVWEDEYRREELMNIFEGMYACTKKRIFNGSYLSFPGLSKDIELYDFQKDAVSRILTTPNTLLAHEVGSGKTYVMIAAGMEARRLGQSDKNIYVVPNSIVGQWKDLFHKMYPDARVLCVDPKSFTPSKRQAILEDIRDNEYDGVIIAYSCFDMIHLSRNHYIQELEAECERLALLSRNRNKATRAVKAKLKKSKEKLAKLYVEDKNTNKDTVFFDEIRVSRLFIDEAHNFKNVPLDSRTNMIQGVNTAGSKKCQRMLDKVRYVQRMNNGGGVVMATGTPITNSISDIYIMQKYLQNGELTLLDLQSFDAWIGMFAERSTNFEIDVDTNSYKVSTRFSKFHNLPELTALISSFADFHKTGCMEGIPSFQGYSNVSISKNQEFCDFLEDISLRADAVRKKRVRRTEDNLLKITTDGRKAALDMRLVDENCVGCEISKVNTCADNVANIYHATAGNKNTQVVFCDISTPKDGFNIYDEMKDLLIARGIPETEIAYIHDAYTEREKNSLFSKFCRGEIRILIGSTFKLGLGVNIQERLIAMHHLDVPWRPADMTQREGRILRQGNICKEVQIFRYYTEGSFDAYSWQILETKQSFINDLLSGYDVDRTMDDVNDTVLSYAEIKALSVGNPLLKERCELSNELYRIRTIRRKEGEEHSRMEERLNRIVTYIEARKKGLFSLDQDVQNLKAWNEKQREVLDSKAKSEKQFERKLFCNMLNTALENNLLHARERYYSKYKNFKILLPADMTEEEPYIWLQGLGRYQVALGRHKERYMADIDIYISRMERRCDEWKKEIAEKENEVMNVRKELEKKYGYDEKIVYLRKRLEEIDQLLEVKTNGK